MNMVLPSSFAVYNMHVLYVCTVGWVPSITSENLICINRQYQTHLHGMKLNTRMMSMCVLG